MKRGEGENANGSDLMEARIPASDWGGLGTGFGNSTYNRDWKKDVSREKKILARMKRGEGEDATGGDLYETESTIAESRMTWDQRNSLASTFAGWLWGTRKKDKELNALFKAFEKKYGPNGEYNFGNHIRSNKKLIKYILAHPAATPAVKKLMQDTLARKDKFGWLGEGTGGDLYESKSPSAILEGLTIQDAK